MLLDFDASEKVALTEENGNIIFWTTEGGGKPRAFSSDRGKAVLSGDGGYRWKNEKKEADNCFYGQIWLGDFPYGSWCWAIRQCKLTGEIDVKTITTDINPRGLSASERWIQGCKAYAPV